MKLLDRKRYSSKVLKDLYKHYPIYIEIAFEYKNELENIGNYLLSAEILKKLYNKKPRNREIAFEYGKILRYAENLEQHLQ